MNNHRDCGNCGQPRVCSNTLCETCTEINGYFKNPVHKYNWFPEGTIPVIDAILVSNQRRKDDGEL